MLFFKKYYTFVLLNILFSYQIDIDQASLIARNFIDKESNINFQIIDIEREDMIYIVNLTPSGFIVISADNVSIPVLGYSFNNNLNLDSIPSQLDALLKDYNSQINYLIDNNNPNRLDLWNGYLNSENAFHQRQVSPLIQSNWNQGDGWNSMCPSNTYVGCVAVAMGQAMHYWSYPDQGIGFNMYYLPDYGFLSADFETAFYDFDSMENNAPTEASSLLLFHAGISVDMHYSPYGSGASVCWDSNSAQAALDEHFQYNDDITCMNKIDYSSEDWSLIIKDQLDRGWPVIYRGYSESAGHAWNIDGYDESNYFHCNWGWGGSANGYYYLDPLSDNSISFIENQAALLNILPEGLEEPLALFEFEIEGLEVMFSDLSSIINSDEIINWFWDFGDGSISSTQSPIYQYQDYGVYEISLIVRNEYGLDSQAHIETVELVSSIGRECELSNGEVGFYDCELCCWDVSLLSWLGDGYCDQFGGCAWEGPQFDCYQLGYDCGDCSEDWDELDPSGLCEDCPVLGDINGDSMVNVLDVIEVANCILFDSCSECSDVNGDGSVNIQDILTIVNQVLEE